MKHPTFDQIGVEHLRLLKLQDGIFGVAGPEVDIRQTDQDVHVIPQKSLLLQGTTQRQVNDNVTCRECVCVSQMFVSLLRPQVNL